MTIIEQDAGLWQVWNKAGCCVGFVFDGGWKVSGQKRRRNSLYHALAGWDNGPWQKQGRLGKSNKFMGAIKHLFKNENSNSKTSV